jgi:hypothetical protein
MIPERGHLPPSLLDDVGPIQISLLKHNDDKENFIYLIIVSLSFFLDNYRVPLGEDSTFIVRWQDSPSFTPQ